VSYLSAAGFACVRGRILLPRRGVWIADVVIEPSTGTAQFPSIGAPVQLVLAGSLTLQGTARRVAQAYGTVLARLVGGGGGFPDVVAAKGYQNVETRIPINDLLGEIGESLSGQSDQTFLGTQLPFWSRRQGPAYKSFASLVEGHDWRVQPDGTTWIGTDGWPRSSMGSYQLLSYLPNELRMTIFSDTPSILPGQTLPDGSGFVSSVEHVVEPGKVRSILLFEDPALLQASAQ